MAAEPIQPPPNTHPAPSHRDGPSDRDDPDHPDGPGAAATPAGRVGDRRRPNNGGSLGFTYTIYRFYSATDRLLYLGESARVRHRIVDLEIGNPRGLPLGHDDGPKPWWREAVRIELQHLPPGTTEEEARAEERRQIELERPVYNRTYNEEGFDRGRLERVLDLSHFESDVATVEHERHDGVIRDLARIDIESRRSADRLRPGGSGLLDRLARRGTGRPAPADTGQQRIDLTGSDPTVAEPVVARQTPPRQRSTPTFYPRQPRTAVGPGSRLGLALVGLILAAIVALALAMSLQAVL
ncbi:MAG: hypothetical protein AAF547_22410 [Actinomycetota bacterium]